MIVGYPNYLRPAWVTSSRSDKGFGECVVRQIFYLRGIFQVWRGSSERNMLPEWYPPGLWGCSEADVLPEWYPPGLWGCSEADVLLGWYPPGLWGRCVTWVVSSRSGEAAVRQMCYLGGILQVWWWGCSEADVLPGWYPPGLVRL